MMRKKIDFFLFCHSHFIKNIMVKQGQQFTTPTRSIFLLPTQQQTRLRRQQVRQWIDQIPRQVWQHQNISITPQTLSEGKVSLPQLYSFIKIFPSLVRLRFPTEQKVFLRKGWLRRLVSSVLFSFDIVMESIRQMMDMETVETEQKMDILRWVYSFLPQNLEVRERFLRQCYQYGWLTPEIIHHRFEHDWKVPQAPLPPTKNITTGQSTGVQSTTGGGAGQVMSMSHRSFSSQNLFGHSISRRLGFSSSPRFMSIKHIQGASLDVLLEQLRKCVPPEDRGDYHKWTNILSTEDKETLHLLLFCPISQDYTTHPVIASDGGVYDRDSFLTYVDICQRSHTPLMSLYGRGELSSPVANSFVFLATSLIRPIVIRVVQKQTTDIKTRPPRPPSSLSLGSRTGSGQYQDIPK